MRERPLTPLVLTVTERRELLALTLQPETGRTLAVRARIVLACAEGQDNKAVAAQQEVTPRMVAKWRARFVEKRLDGLRDLPRAGGPRSIDAGCLGAVIAMTMQCPPVGEKRWTSRSMASATGLSQSTISRIWRACGVQPHRQG